MFQATVVVKWISEFCFVNYTCIFSFFVIYPEVKIHAMCVDEAKVSPLAAHPGQLAGC